MQEDPKLPIVATVTYRGHEIGITQYPGTPASYARNGRVFAHSIEEAFKIIDKELETAHPLIGKTVAVNGTAYIGKYEFAIVVPGTVKRYNEKSKCYRADLESGNLESLPFSVNLYADPWETFTEWTPEHQRAYDAFLAAVDAYNAANEPLLKKCREASDAMKPLIQTAYLNAF